MADDTKDYNRRTGIIHLTYEVLSDLLDLPVSTSIKNVFQTAQDMSMDCVSINVRSPNLPVLPEGEVIPWISIEEL